MRVARHGIEKPVGSASAVPVSRLLSSSVAIVVGLIAAMAFGIVAQAPWAFAGIPVAGIAGAWLGPRLDPTTSLSIVWTLAMTATCTVGGAYAIGLAGGIYAPLLGTIGLVYFGVPAFLLLLVPAAAWAAATTFLARRGWA